MVIQDLLKTADAIIVLGGNLPFRSQAALLYRQGWGKRALSSKAGENAQIAEHADQGMILYDRLSNSAGPIDSHSRPRRPATRERRKRQ